MVERVSAPSLAVAQAQPLQLPTQPQDEHSARARLIPIEPGPHSAAWLCDCVKLRCFALKAWLTMFTVGFTQQQPFAMRTRGAPDPSAPGLYASRVLQGE
jgi:hypothetical protein